MTRSEETIYLARKFSFMREVGGQNKGRWVGAFQHLCDGRDGDSWCCYYACVILAIVFGGFTKSPIGMHGAVQDVYELAQKQGWIREHPVQIGDLFFYVTAEGHAHHIGFVTDDTPLTGIAGNTSEDGVSSNGTGVFEHGIGAKVFAHWPRGE